MRTTGTASGKARRASSSHGDSSSDPSSQGSSPQSERAEVMTTYRCARAIAAEPHRERALARAAVGLEVTQVVDHEDRGREQPDRHGQHEASQASCSTCTK